MSEQEEDFAAMFEASVKARRFEGPDLQASSPASGRGRLRHSAARARPRSTSRSSRTTRATSRSRSATGSRRRWSTGGGIVLSRKGVRNAATQRELEDAYRAGMSVEGKVEKAVKGGYEVRIASERAFCPLSQIDITRTEDPAVHEGKTYAFRIIEYKDGGRIWSSRAASTSRPSRRRRRRSCARRLSRARSCPAGSRRCRTSAPSSISAAASRACSTSPR